MAFPTHSPSCDLKGGAPLPSDQGTQAPRDHQLLSLPSGPQPYALAMPPNLVPTPLGHSTSACSLVCQECRCAEHQPSPITQLRGGLSAAPGCLHLDKHSRCWIPQLFQPFPALYHCLGPRLPPS